MHWYYTFEEAGEYFRNSSAAKISPTRRFFRYFVDLFRKEVVEEEEMVVEEDKIDVSDTERHEEFLS